VAVLRKVIVQDTEQDAQGAVRLRKGVTEDRLISVGDPEMRRGHKSEQEPFEGYKLHHTCDVTHGFVLAIEVTGANVHDSVPSAPMAERAEQSTGSLLVKVIGDGAYSAERNRVAHQETGRTLVAKLPRPRRTSVFPKSDFTIDLVQGVVSCPQGQTTTIFTLVRPNNVRPRAGDPEEWVRRFRFPTPSCLSCPERANCIPSYHSKRIVDVGPHEELFLAARPYEQTPVYAKDRRARQVAERVVARMVQLGARQARVVGLAKVRAQMTMIAAVTNLTRLVALRAQAMESRFTQAA
jgi:hypothetical protein